MTTSAPSKQGERSAARKAESAAKAPRAPGPGLPTDRPAPVADAAKVVAWLSISAGAIHAVAAIDHFSHWWLYGAFFVALTYGQVLWGVSLLRKTPSDRNLTIGALGTLGIVAVWLFTRTVLVPFGPEAGSAEPVGVMDVAVTLEQVVLVAYVAVIVRPAVRATRGLRVLLGPHRIRLGMMLCSASFFAALLGGHSH